METKGIEDIIGEVQPDVVVTLNGQSVEDVRCLSKEITVLIIDRDKSSAFLYGADMPAVEGKGLTMPGGFFKTR